MARIYGCIVVCTGVEKCTLRYDPYIRAYVWVMMRPYIRAVFMGSAYRALVMFVKLLLEISGVFERLWW